VAHLSKRLCREFLNGPAIFCAGALAITAALSPAAAQTAAPDEFVSPKGEVSQPSGLSASQRSAIYNLVVRDRVRIVDTKLAAIVGAPVPPWAELRDLPNQAEGDEIGALLKYAMVDGNIVIVDPIARRVVDVIRADAKP
jgi:hypothetical protein